MTLYGKALAETVPVSTTGHQARLAFGQMTVALKNAYTTLADYDKTGIGRRTGLDAGSIETARKYLDDVNKTLQVYFPQMPASAAPLTSDQLTKLKTAVSATSVAVKLIDDIFSTSFLSQLASSIGEAFVTVTKTIAKVPAQVAQITGESISDTVAAFVKKTWWVILLAGGVWVGFIYLQGRTVRAFAPKLQGAKQPRVRARKR